MQKNVDTVRETAKELSPGAMLMVTDSVATADDAIFIQRKKDLLLGMDLQLTHAECNTEIQSSLRRTYFCARGHQKADRECKGAGTWCQSGSDRLGGDCKQC